jgi:hypothetical protein
MIPALDFSGRVLQRTSGRSPRVQTRLPLLNENVSLDQVIPSFASLDIEDGPSKCLSSVVKLKPKTRKSLSSNTVPLEQDQRLEETSELGRTNTEIILLNRRDLIIFHSLFYNPE